MSNKKKPKLSNDVRAMSELPWRRRPDDEFDFEMALCGYDPKNVRKGIQWYAIKVSDPDCCPFHYTLLEAVFSQA
jgi:hypothetical protein